MRSRLWKIPRTHINWRHVRSPGSFEAQLTILVHRACCRFDAHEFRRLQEHIRRGLAMLDVLRPDHHLEQIRNPDDLQALAHRADASAAGNCEFAPPALTPGDFYDLG